MGISILLFIVDAALINVGYLCSFLIRFGGEIPARNFLPFKENFVFLTLINILALSLLKVYKNRFKSSWDLFKRIFLALFLGTLSNVAFVYVFRIRWASFPTSVCVLAFFLNVLLIFTLNSLTLKTRGRIRKRIAVIGKEKAGDILEKNAHVERIEFGDIQETIRNKDIDEIVICERIRDEKNLNILIYLLQKVKIDVAFSPSVYRELVSERINEEVSFYSLSTFVGKKSDGEEFLIRSLDVIVSLLVLFVSSPLIILISFLIKVSSPGPVFYKQDRLGRNGEIFILYKFRTMVKDAEKHTGPVWASPEDKRATSLGKLLRRTRTDELPQLLNVLRGDMSLVGPRPERPHFAKLHKALSGTRLAVSPGITGLAQIRNLYNLKPQHKVKYDLLYIQRRSFLLNLYILTQTIPALFAKRGW